MENKARIGNKIMDVVELNDYMNNPSTDSYVAINYDGYLYPVRTKSDGLPGYYQCGPLGHLVAPVTEEDKKIYSSDNIIDFNNVSNFKEVIDKQNQLRSAERIILTNPDNIFTPEIRENDAPEMVALKTAIIKKNIDIDKYEQRFGNNFNNDKRLFNNSSITLAKLKGMGKAFDMKMTLTIEDSSPNVPNPIGERITVDLLSADGGDE